MINLTEKGGLPNVVTINGSPYSVYTDFRLWMRFEIAVSKLQRNESIDVSYLFMNDMPERCDLRELFVFSRPQNELPRFKGHSDVIALDYELDADYIYAAFMSRYRIDLCEAENLHWHKFLALLNGLKGELICDIMTWRCYEKSDAKTDMYAELREAWAIDRVSPLEQAARDKFSSYFD